MDIIEWLEWRLGGTGRASRGKTRKIISELRPPVQQASQYLLADGAVQRVRHYGGGRHVSVVDAWMHGERIGHTPTHLLLLVLQSTLQ
jgi:hypothetical protein